MKVDVIAYALLALIDAEIERDSASERKILSTHTVGNLGHAKLKLERMINE